MSIVNRSSHLWHIKWSSSSRWARRASRHFISFELWIELFVLQPLILICSALQKRFQYEHQSWTWGLWSCNHLQDIRFSPCIEQRQMNRRLRPRRRSSAVRNDSCRAQGTYPAAVMDMRQIMGSAMKGSVRKKGCHGLKSVCTFISVEKIVLIQSMLLSDICANLLE